MRFTYIAPVVLGLLSANAVLAGPPLICHQFNIGGAKSLPWSAGTDWENPDPAYSTSRLAADTLSILDEKAPALVRMETMRRAAIYSVRDHAAGRDILARLGERLRAKPSAVANFDYGYFAATLKQLEWKFKEDMSGGVNGWDYVNKALADRPDDPGMHFAAALMADRQEMASVRASHMAKARAASSDPLLAANLRSYDRY